MTTRAYELDKTNYFTATQREGIFLPTSKESGGLPISIPKIIIWKNIMMGDLTYKVAYIK